MFPRWWYNPNALYPWYNIPSLVCTLTMLPALSSPPNRSREKESWDVRSAPRFSFSDLGDCHRENRSWYSRGNVGRIVSYGCRHAAFSKFLLQDPFFCFCFLNSSFVCAISGSGLFISSLCSTQQQAMLGTFVFMLPSVLFSGFATPIENMPDLAAARDLPIPLRYMLINTKGIFLKDMPFNLVLNNIWPMALIAAFTLINAGILFRRRFREEGTCCIFWPF